MDKCYLLEWNPIGGHDIGYLVSLESYKNIPFDIKRTYYTYNVPNTVKRGLHAHKTLKQVLICLKGELKVKCSDGVKEETFLLDNPNEGLFIGKNIWREMSGYKEDTLLIVLASDFYDESDYIRDYDEFLRYVRSNI
ncbi:dTDP-6-deoxy-3,4-keto-hexulose isomerase [Clostridioides difficile]|nr:dTDP-6-deoxy-3,4-keto-hexulose isomerase [Clostridioides difficile]